MDPLTIGALVAGGASVLGSGANAFSQYHTNQQNQRFSREMYDLQKRDNLNQWHLQNDYNSPQQQMTRLQKAGLNPNLVYGSGAANQSAPVPTASPTVVQAQAPQWGNMADGLGQYFDIEMKQAQTDNMKAAITVATQEALLKASQVAGQGIANARNQFDYDQAYALKDISLEASKQNLRKLVADTDFQINENERRETANATSLKEAAERILTMRAQRETGLIERTRIRENIKQIQNSNILSGLDIQLKRAGIQPNDPLYARILGRAVGSGAGDFLQDVDKWTRDKSKSFKEHILNYFKD